MPKKILFLFLREKCFLFDLHVHLRCCARGWLIDFLVRHVSTVGFFVVVFLVWIFFFFFLWLCGCMLHTHTRTHTHTCTWFLCVACRLTISGLVLVTQWSCTVPFLSVNPSTCINVICSLPSIIVWWRCLCEDCGCIKWRSLIFTFQY